MHRTLHSPRLLGHAYADFLGHPHLLKLSQRSSPLHTFPSIPTQCEPTNTSPPLHLFSHVHESPFVSLPL